MFKNVSGQIVVVRAWNADGTPKTLDAAQITCVISKDGAADAATNDVNPTEIGSGKYSFDMTQAETNADEVSLTPVSSTPDITVSPVDIYTVTPMRGTDSAALDATVAKDATVALDATVAKDADTAKEATVVAVGNLVAALNDITAADVWAVGTRTLTSFGTLVADVWAFATRTLTGEVDIGAVKGVAVTGVDDFKADLTDVALESELQEGISALGSSDAPKPAWMVGNFVPTSDALHAASLKLDALSPTGSTINPVTITITDQFAAPVIGAQIQFSDDATGTVFLGSGLTDSNGQIIFAGHVPGNYRMTGVLAFYTIPVTTVTVVVGASAQAVSAVLAIVSPPATLDLSRLFGYVVSVESGDPVENAIVGVAAVCANAPVFVNSNGVSLNRVTAVTDATGFFEIDILQDVEIVIDIDVMDYRKTTTLITPTKNIADIP